MTITAPRRPRGTTTGGQFAPTVRSEPCLQLQPGPAPTDDLVNGLRVTQNASGRWMLVDASTRRPIRRDAERTSGSYATAQEAADWAAHTYPLVSKVRATIDSRFPTLTTATPECARCGARCVPAGDTDDDGAVREAWECPTCGTTTWAAPRPSVRLR